MATSLISPHWCPMHHPLKIYMYTLQGVTLQFHHHPQLLITHLTWDKPKPKCIVLSFTPPAPGSTHERNFVLPLIPILQSNTLSIPQANRCKLASGSLRSHLKITSYIKLPPPAMLSFHSSTRPTLVSTAFPFSSSFRLVFHFRFWAGPFFVHSLLCEKP